VLRKSNKLFPQIIRDHPCLVPTTTAVLYNYQLSTINYQLPNEAVSLAKGLFQQTRQDIASPKLQKDLIELLETIMVYKLPNKGREEIEAMFGLSELKQTKVYQEAKMEGIIEGETKGRMEGEIKGEIKAKMEAVPGLLKLGLTVEQIATALKLSVEEIQQVISSNN